VNSTAHKCLLIGWVFAFAVAAPARAEPYIIEGMKLGVPIDTAAPDYRSFKCAPSEQFEGYMRCQRTKPSARGTLSSTIIHGGDGTAIYLSAKLAPTSIDRDAAQREIEELSREMKEQPKHVEWVPARAGTPASVVAWWGRIELRQLKRSEVDDAANGYAPGLLIDPLADPARAAKAGLPIYRVAGAAGYVYAAIFGSTGQKSYIAADVSLPALKTFETGLNEVLQEDQALPANDYKLWPQVSELTRNLSLATSATIANEALDKIFERYPSKKLRSHVWSLLPLGSLLNLSERAHWTVSIYGPNTEYPEIREAIQKFLAEHPNEPFSEFLYYTIGDFETALQRNPNSIIAGVVRYAIGYRIIDSLLQDTTRIVKLPNPPDSYEPVNSTLVVLNEHPELYENKLLGTIVPSFASRAAAAKPWLEQVLGDASSPHQDDAAYMLGWLDFHQGDFKTALSYLSRAMSSGNGDYRKPAAMRQVVRIMARLPAPEQVALVQSDSTFMQQPALWYMAARTAYRDFNYPLAIDTSQRGLTLLHVPVDTLPATTDPQKIKGALDKVEPKLDDDLNLSEMPYLLEASREILDYERYLATAANDRPENLSRKARAIIVKYSMLLDPTEQSKRRRAPELAHKDLRQAIHLIDVSLAAVPKTAQQAPLREWLYYRKARTLVQFAPASVADVVAALEQEYPRSQLLDDALAEQVFAEGVMLRDVDAAQRTFQRLISSFPNGNALDNAYTWMAIIDRCAGRLAEAQKLNREIIRLFPTTRHARYARERTANPKSCGLETYSQQ
jgi:tetratricopeptide (TPR) repeat protein